MKYRGKLILFSIIIIIGISLSSCQNPQSPTGSVPQESQLKIPVPSDVNGKIITDMAGVDITSQTKNLKAKGVTSAGIEDQYLVDDFNNDGVADVAVRRGSLIIIDWNRDGIADHSFTFGNGNSERGYYNYHGGIAIVRGNSIYIDTNLDGTADISFTYGNGNSEDEYLFCKGGFNGVAVRRGNTIYLDTDLDGNVNNTFSYGNGNSEDQYTSDGGFSYNGWGCRTGSNWRFYGTLNTYSYGLGNSEDGYFLGKWPGSSYYRFAVLRHHVLYYDNNMDETSDGSVSFGTGLKTSQW